MQILHFDWLRYWGNSHWVAKFAGFTFVYFPLGVGYLTKFNTGRLRPEVQPLTLLYTVLAEKVPLLYTFYWKKEPLSHTYFGKSCSHFHVVLEQINWYSHKDCLVEINKIPKWPMFLPFYIPQLVKSLPFYIPEARKRYPFRAEPSRVGVGHYREYLPRIFPQVNFSSTCIC